MALVLLVVEGSVDAVVVVVVVVWLFGTAAVDDAPVSVTVAPLVAVVDDDTASDGSLRAA